MSVLVVTRFVLLRHTQSQSKFVCLHVYIFIVLGVCLQDGYGKEWLASSTK